MGFMFGKNSAEPSLKLHLSRLERQSLYQDNRVDMAMATSYMMYFRNRRLSARQEVEAKTEDDGNKESLVPTDKPTAHKPLNDDKSNVAIQDTCQKRLISNEKIARNGNS